MNRLEHMTYKESLGELEMLRLEKRRFSESLSICTDTLRRSKEERIKLLDVVSDPELQAQIKI